jgi:hypothetical protein
MTASRARVAPWWAAFVLAVWATVGPWAAAAAAVIGVWHVVAPPPPRRLLTVALVAVVAVPLLWFAGASGDFNASAARIQQNVLAHQVGGLAVWLLTVAVLRDVAATRKVTG